MSMTLSVKQLEPRETAKFIDAVRLGERTLLDVRQDFEYAEGHLPGAQHIPLPELSERLGELNTTLPILTYCRSGARSLAAANMLAGQGFRDVMSMKGGMLAWKGAQAQGSLDLGISSLVSASTPAALLERAWGMEYALETFYNALVERTPDKELSALFQRLADFEEKHRRTLFEVWTRIEAGQAGASSASTAAQAAFEARARASLSPGILEGGIPAQDYLGHMAHPSDESEALELAMAVEAQALDLYMRRSKTASDKELQRTLILLAEEERAHLKVLGAFATGRGRL
jgi:rhodanese-related sulfurtransferase/rubrerythrin